MPEHSRRNDKSNALRTFIVCYFSNAPDCTFACLHGPWGRQTTRVGANGLFLDVPEGNGYILELRPRGQPPLPPEQFDLHADHVTYFTLPVVIDDPSQLD